MKIYRNVLWAWRVLLSRNYVVVTDNEAVCSIQVKDPESIESVARLEFQSIVLGKIRESIVRLESEHSDAIALLKRRQRGKS